MRYDVVPGPDPGLSASFLFVSKVLIIDDDLNLGRLLELAFKEKGHDACVVANGEDGMHACANQPFDLVVTDIFMPGMDGIEVIQGLRMAGNTVKIIAISGGGLVGERDTFLAIAKAMGADLAVSKPFSPSDFMSAAWNLLNHPAEDDPDA